MHSNRKMTRSKIDNLNWNFTEIKIGILLYLSIILFTQTIKLKIDFLLIMLIFDLTLCALIFIFLIKRKKSWLQILGLRKFKKEFLAEGVGLLIFCYFLIILFKILLSLLKIEIPIIDLKYLYGAVPSVWLLVIDLAIKGPFVEEFFFRGFIFSGLSVQYGWKKALFLSSLIFAIGHISPNNIYSFVPSFIFGCALCYLYHISKSILPGFITHAFHNFIIFAITYKQFISS